MALHATHHSPQAPQEAYTAIVQIFDNQKTDQSLLEAIQGYIRTVEDAQEYALLDQSFGCDLDVYTALMLHDSLQDDPEHYELKRE